MRLVDISLYYSKRTPVQEIPTLEEFLKATDEELERVAGLCGALVVKHTWTILEGVGTGPTDTTLLALKPELPQNGCKLAATVDRIHALEILPEVIHNISPYFIDPTVAAYNQVDTGVQQYYSAHDRDPEEYKGVLLTDIHPEQFALGYNTNSTSEEIELWLLDIEPRLIWSP